MHAACVALCVAETDVRPWGQMLVGWCFAEMRGQQQQNQMHVCAFSHAYVHMYV